MRVDCHGDRSCGAARMAGAARWPHGAKKAGGATCLRFGARSPAPIHRLSVDADGISSREWAWGVWADAKSPDCVPPDKTSEVQEWES